MSCRVCELHHIHITEAIIINLWTQTMLGQFDFRWKRNNSMGDSGRALCFDHDVMNCVLQYEGTSVVLETVPDSKKWIYGHQRPGDFRMWISNFTFCLSGGWGRTKWMSAVNSPIHLEFWWWFISKFNRMPTLLYRISKFRSPPHIEKHKNIDKMNAVFRV